MSALLAIGVILGTSLVAALVFTPAVRALALRAGAVAQPSADRWHKQPTALLVGSGWAVRAEAAVTRPALGLGLSAAFMCVVGLVDDILRLRPPAKFLLQLLAGVALLTLGAVLRPSQWTRPVSRRAHHLPTGPGVRAAAKCLSSCGLRVWWGGELASAAVRRKEGRGRGDHAQRSKVSRTCGWARAISSAGCEANGRCPKMLASYPWPGDARHAARVV